MKKAQSSQGPYSTAGITPVIFAISEGSFRNAGMQLNHTILEPFERLQIQGHVEVTSPFHWSA